MHVLIVQEKVPAPIGGRAGTDVTGASIIRAAVMAGHRVTFCVVASAGKPLEKATDAVDVTGGGRGVDLVRVPLRRQARASAIRRGLTAFRRALRPVLDDFYPAAEAVEAVRDLVTRVKPDVVLAYPLTAVAAIRAVDGPRVAVVVDLPHLVAWYRWRFATIRSPRQWIGPTLGLLAARKHVRFMRELLSPCEAVINLAAHHAAWLREHGVPQCIYVPMPTLDLAEGRWRRSSGPRTPAKILLLGNLRGAATLPGLYVFAREILPALERRLGSAAFEAHLVGRYKPPPDLAPLLSRPTVRMRGYVDDIREEFSSADVLLVPTPIALGTRTRMIIGAAFGCCMVAHQANVLGTPEFGDGRDVLLGRDGCEMAEAVIRVLTDATLRERLGREARTTYERHFTVETAGRRLLEELEIATSRWFLADAR